MNEKELKVAIEQLTAISEFALDLRLKLTNQLNSPAVNVPAEVMNKVADKAVNCVKEAVKEVKNAVADLDTIIKEYELSAMKVGEIREYLDGYEIEYPEKAKKPELIQILAQAIADGRIGEDDESDDDADTDNDESDDDASEDAGDSDDEDGDSDEDADRDSDNDYEPSAERVAAEEEVEETIRKQYHKKLKISAIKKFLKMYYDGDAEMADLDEYEDDDLLEMYVEIQKALVDDEGTVTKMETLYERDGEYYCCGKPVVNMEDSDNVYCEVCGNEYGE